jgi:hypothetical protein
MFFWAYVGVRQGVGVVTAEAEAAERFGREKFSAGLPLDFFTFVVCGVNGFGGVAGWLTSIL